MERLTPEEYKNLQFATGEITSESEELRQRGLLSDALDELDDIEKQVNRVLPDTPNQQLLTETLVREKIHLDDDLPENLEGREKIASQLYKEITGLLKGRLAPWYGEISKKVEKLWDDLGHEWEAHNKGLVLESELIVKTGQAIQQLRLLQKQIVNRKE